MKITVTETIFKNAFVEMGRKDNFSYEGLSALFEYLEETEKDIGEDWELDVIALCCEFSEEHYSDIAENFGINDEFESVLEYLENETLVIYANEEDGCILYQNF